MNNDVQPGERVTTYLCLQPDIQYIGNGVLLGTEYNDVIEMDNPKIELDNGDIVWGYQCWWMAEDPTIDMESLCQNEDYPNVTKVDLPL